jgi:hypothetical protein
MESSVTVSTQELAHILPTLDKSQLYVLVRSVLGLKTEEQQNNISVVDRLKAGIFEFMLAIGFVSDAQGRAVLARLEAPLNKIVSELRPESNVLPVFKLHFVEQRWAAWPTCAVWYDLRYDEDVAELPEPGVLIVTCDVTALYLRQEAALSKLRRSKDAKP